MDVQNCHEPCSKTPSIETKMQIASLLSTKKDMFYQLFPEKQVGFSMSKFFSFFISSFLF
jgi:hypothetical protein